MTSDPRPSPSDPLAEAIRQFNSWRFWDCHETLEDLWHAESASGGDLANFYRGLTKLAAGFHHLLRGNHKGAINLLGGGLQLLESFRPHALGIDLDPVLVQTQACQDGIQKLGPNRIQEFDRSLIPTISFDLPGPSLQPQDGFVQANGLRLHYLNWDSQGPPAVLLHASSFLARLWQPIAQELSHDFRVLACDARGHGDSEKPGLEGPALPAGPGNPAEGPANAYGWDHFGQDLIAFLEVLGLRSVLAVGHSGGAAAIAHAAVQRPDLFDRIVLIEPIIAALIDGEEDQRNELVTAARRRRPVWPSRDELFHAYRARPPFDGWRQDILRLYADYGTSDRPDGQVELKCPREVEAQVYEGRTAIDVFAALPQVRCPALILHGQYTDAWLARAAQATAARIPNARLVVVAETTHMVPMERPEAIVAAMRDFLGES
jgi:pimeloyl-ACP methyl ester carboxylesterase